MKKISEYKGKRTYDHSKRVYHGARYSSPQVLFTSSSVDKLCLISKFCTTSLKLSFRMDQIPSSPLNSSSTEWRYDVFLSFRGEDTRTGFTDHLYAALVDKGIRTFRDSEELRRGEEIEGELLKAIHESRIFIIIFSEDYANSKWCLKELAEISKCKAKGRKVFPVFYHVDPSEVRNQSGYYGEAFAAYENDANQDSERIQVWRTALKEAGHIIGYHIDKE